MKIIFKIRLFRVIREIFLFREYLSQIRKEKQGSSVFAKFRLRIDWVGRIYTVINLPKEVTESPDLPRDSRPAYVLEEIKPINDYIKSINLEELVTVVFKPIPGTNDDSFLVIYQYIFREFTWLWILRVFLLWSAVFGTYKYFF
jgi:hypothetical protein